MGVCSQLSLTKENGEGMWALYIDLSGVKLSDQVKTLSVSPMKFAEVLWFLLYCFV